VLASLTTQRHTSNSPPPNLGKRENKMPDLYSQNRNRCHRPSSKSSKQMCGTKLLQQQTPPYAPDYVSPQDSQWFSDDSDGNARCATYARSPPPASMSSISLSPVLTLLFFHFFSSAVQQATRGIQSPFEDLPYANVQSIEHLARRYPLCSRSMPVEYLTISQSVRAKKHDECLFSVTLVLPLRPLVRLVRPLPAHLHVALPQRCIPPRTRFQPLRHLGPYTSPSLPWPRSTWSDGCHHGLCCRLLSFSMRACLLIPFL
jgi:hypothetical protein